MKTILTAALAAFTLLGGPSHATPEREVINPSEPMVMLAGLEFLGYSRISTVEACAEWNGIKDYFQYQDLWSNKRGDCCDVRGNVPSITASAQSVPWNIRMDHAPAKEEALETQKTEEAWSTHADLANPTKAREP
jgi:hypothetical protein